MNTSAATATAAAANDPLPPESRTHEPFCLSFCACRAGRSKKAEEDDGFAKVGKGKKGKGNKKADPSLLGFSVESSRIMQGEIEYAEGQ